MAIRRKSKNKVTIHRRRYEWVCQLCGEITQSATQLASRNAAARHIRKYHTVTEASLVILDALEDMVGGVPEYRAVIRRQRTRTKEVMELERMYQLRDRRRK
jgi:hypothetical protein